MAGELTQQESEQFYDISARVDEYDPGLDAFTETVRRGEAFLNRSGGYDSMSYNGTLIELNDQWEYLDQAAKVTGKVYVSEEGIVGLAPGEWTGPFTDANGSYFLVEDVELISTGILDSLASEQGDVAEDGTLNRPVRFAFGFNPEGLESDIPVFYALPDDILMMKYELPTLDAVVSRLHRDWPDVMATIDRRVGKSVYNPMKLVKKMRRTIEEMQEPLRSSEDFRHNIARYIHHAMELDRAWPYGVTIKGPAFYAESPDELPETVTFKEPGLQYLKSAGLSIMEYTNETPHRVELSFIFAVPSSITDGESIDGQLAVPLGSIKHMFSTRPMGSISESVGLAKDARQARELVPEEAEIEMPDVAPEKYTHPIIVKFRRLVKLEQLLSEAQSRTKDVQRTRHSNARDALEVSANLAAWFHQQVQELELENTDLLRVSGPGVVKANGIQEYKDSRFRIDISEEHPIINPTVVADTIGYYQGMTGEVDQFEDDEGCEFWQAAPKLGLNLFEVSQPLVTQNNYPLLTVATRSSALARLDDKTYFEIPELDAMRRRHAAMAALVASHPKASDLKDAYAVERAFFNEDPASWAEAGSVLKTIRRMAQSVTEETNKELFDTLKQQLLGRRIEIDANTWFANSRSDDHHNVGVVTDMFTADLPDGTNELVINVADGIGKDDGRREQEAAALVILRTATALKF